MVCPNFIKIYLLFNLFVIFFYSMVLSSFTLHYKTISIKKLLVFSNQRDTIATFQAE
ncbi:hypothetical protein BRADI_2g10822v3 [Brachypodium distachyon]|uniref:Uncharacterized protein n=1 Tax=Brachypodium distachyon TaxID=15368 RepID=A0A2K2D7W3_BRADI|nr:hypothetical protein BRADI_2g10822v3 [Brachypodium distachyon]